MTAQPLDRAAPSPPSDIALRINPSLDVSALARAYRDQGHVRIERILADGAREMFAWFDQCTDWIQLISADGGAIEIDYARWIEMPRAERRAIEQEMYRRAADGFQYSYAAMRVPDEGERLHYGDPMTRFAEFMESAETQKFLEAITGTRSPAFNDGQATAYGTGDFLTGHDDDVAGRCRTTACVFGLTPQWRLEWGGLLLFHDLGSRDVTGMVPQFNTLDLFAVPRYHSVSQITPAAPRRRYAITGWLSPS
jgi:SM-20-related protein